MRGVSNWHDKTEAVYESEIAPHIDHKTVEGGRRDCAGRTGLLSEPDELGIWYTDEKTQSPTKRNRFRRIWNSEETS